MKMSYIVFVVLFLAIFHHPCYCFQSTITSNSDTCTNTIVRPDLNFQEYWSPVYGSVGSVRYPDFFTVERIQKIYIRSDDGVRAIKFVFTNGIETPYYASTTTGGTQYIWTVPDCQNIVTINFRTGFWIDAIQFVTNKGTTSPVYGGTGGGPFSATWVVNGGIHGIRASMAYYSNIGSLQFFIQKNWI